MDMRSFSAEDFSTMTPEEKKDFVHQMLTSGATKDGLVKAVLFDKAQGKIIDVGTMIDRLGMDKVEELLLSTMEQADCQVSALSKDEFHTIVEKCIAGTATEEEKDLARMVLHSMRNSMSFDAKEATITCAIHTLLDMMHFVGKKGYNVEYEDFLNAISTMMLGSMLNTPDGAISHLVYVGPEQVLNIQREIGDDIEKALMESIWKDSTPAPEYILLGLMAYMQKVITNAKENNSASMTFIKPQLIADFFGIDCHFDDSDDDQEKNEDENGSNDGNVTTPVCHCAECTCDNHEEKDSENS